MKTLSIKRFACRVRFGVQDAISWITVKESKQHGHHIYSVEAIKLEALDRIVEVVSGNSPHASSASTHGIVPFSQQPVNGAYLYSAFATKTTPAHMKAQDRIDERR